MDIYSRYLLTALQPSGQTGLGKSTLINTIFASHLIDSKGRLTPNEPVRSTTEIQTVSHSMSAKPLDRGSVTDGYRKSLRRTVCVCDSTLLILPAMVTRSTMTDGNPSASRDLERSGLISA